MKRVVMLAALAAIGSALAEEPAVSIDGADRPQFGRTLTGLCSAEGAAFTWERVDAFCEKSSVAVSDAAGYAPRAADCEHWLRVTARVGGEVVGSARIWFSKLPVLYLTTDDGEGVTSKDVYKTAQLRIQGNAEFGEQYGGVTEVKGHGTSSWRTFEQKAYKLKLDKKTDLFGFGKNKHWILVSNYIDMSMMRNRSASDLAKELGIVGMDMTWVVCIVNGEYDGVRMLAEQVRVDKNRVDIGDWESEAEDLADGLCDALKGAKVWTKDEAKENKDLLEARMSEDFSWVSSGKVSFRGAEYALAGLEIPERDGGFLLKLEEMADKEISHFKSRKGVEISFKNPEMASTEPLLVEAARKIWQDFEDATCAADGFNAAGRHYAELADVDSMAAYWLMQETLGNIDGWRRSRYAYVDHGKKLTFGPAWDFDVSSGAFGTFVFGLAALPCHWTVVNKVGLPWETDNNFFREWMDDPLLCLKAYELYWTKVRPWVAAQLAEGGPIDRRADYLAEAGAAQSARFSSIMNFPFKTDLSNFRAYLTKRLAWLDEQFASVDALVASVRTALSEKPYCKGDGKLALTAANGTDVGDLSSTDFAFAAGADAAFAVDVAGGSLLEKLLKRTIATVEVCVNDVKLGACPVEDGRAAFTVPASLLEKPFAAGRSLVAVLGYSADGTLVARNYATVSVRSKALKAAGSAPVLTSATWLQNVRTDTFTVMCETKSCLDGLRLEYWPEGGQRKSARFTYFPTLGGTFVAKAKVDIAGHAGGTVYYQISEHGRVLQEKGSYGKVKLWGAADDGDFTAVVWGDNQSGMSARDWSADPFAAARGAFTHMMTRSPDFGLTTGDMSGSAKYKDQIRPLLLEITNPILGHYIPYYVAWGNHDSKFVSGWATVRPFFSTGYDGSRGDWAVADNYTLVRGDVFFALIDDYGCEANIDVLGDDACVVRYERERTREWLRMVLSSEEAQNAKFRIVLQHAPVYLETWGSYAVPAFRDVFNEFRVDLVLSGHMHGCERIAVPGDTFIQLTNGGLGHLDNDEEVEANYGDATFIGGHKDIPYLWARESAPGVLGPAEPVFMGCLPSYTELNAKGDELTVSFHGFNADGSYIGVFDKFTLTARKPGEEGLLRVSYPEVAYDAAVVPSVAVVPGAPVTKAAWHDFERNALHRDVAAPSAAERDRPATGMSRREAEAFAAWAGGGTGRYRLPTAAELEGEDAGIAEWTGEDDSATGWCRIANCEVGFIATPCADANYLGFRLVENRQKVGLVRLGAVRTLGLTPSEKIVTDFIEDLAEKINGTTIPGEIATLLNTAKVAMKGNADIAADALIALAPVLDNGQLETLFKSYGYTLWSGSGTGRKIDIRKKYAVSKLPTPNDLADKLANLLNSPINGACAKLDEAADSSDAVLTDGVKKLLDLFGVELGDIGDLHFDKADLLAFKAVLKTVQGAVALLKGTDLENDYGTFVRVFGDLDAEAFFVEVPALFKGVRYQAQLNNSKAALKLALTSVKDADALICTRKDAKPHLIGLGDAGHLIAYGDDKIFTVLRGNSDALIAALDGPSAINVKDIFEAIGETKPTWLRRDTYRVSLLPIFKGKYAQAISPETEDDGTLWPETLPDPTFGGVLPDLTMSEALAFFENMQRPQIWTYAAYDEYKVNMPHADGTSNGHGGPRTIRAEVEGAGTLTFAPAMANASDASSLALYVDGVERGVYGNGAAASVSLDVAGAGGHLVEWVFSVTDDVLQPEPGVHPVVDCTFGGGRPEPKEAAVVCEVKDEYAQKAEIEPIAVSVTNVKQAATFKVTGLPSGLKFTANTIYGTPTKSGIFTATVQATLADRTVLKKEVAFAVRDAALEVFVRADFDMSKGKVTGAGAYDPLKKKTVTLKATALKGFVFAGWYLAEERVSRLASYVLPTPTSDVTYEARFVTAEEDLESVGAAVDELTFGAFDDGDAATAATNVMAGVYFEWPVAADAIAVPTVKVSGLPSGLKFTAKPVTKTTGSGKSKVVVTNVPANTIYGTPTAASKVDKKGVVTPSKVKVTVTTSGKSKREFVINLTVDALPAWAVGTFNGGGEDGLAQLTVAKTGKISGKWMCGGTNWTLSAASFLDCARSAEGTNFWSTLTAKSGKATREIELEVTEEAVRGVVFDSAVTTPRREDASGTVLTASGTVLFVAFRNGWKEEPLKTLAKALKGAWWSEPVDGGTIAFTVGASGAVTAKGTFVIGFDAKRKKDITYTASCSTVLIPTEVDDEYLVFYYFPPKAGKFAGFVGQSVRSLLP